MNSPVSFDHWLGSFRWLQERGIPCIISADLDGLACGLFQQRYLGWEIKGTYDGTSLCLNDAPEAIDWTKVVFLDLEILRGSARCIGNHMLAIDRDDTDRLASTYPHCANPNLWRRFNAWDSFQRKYLFGTLPLVVAAHLRTNSRLSLDRIWLALILQTDSAFTNAATYQSNALDWLSAMGGSDGNHPIAKLCTLLRRLPAQAALKLIEEIQQMGAQAGFGAKQRACRFCPRDDAKRTKAFRLGTAIAARIGVPCPNWLDRPPVYFEEFQTSALPAHSKRTLSESLRRARSDGVVSLAITGATLEGFSYTLANDQSRIALLRRPT